MLGELLTSVAEAHPNKPALITRSGHVQYGEFDVRARRLAHGLLRFGLQQGDRVAFQLPNGIEAPLCHYACFKAGLVGVPCNTRLTAGEIAFVLEHSEARVYICSRGSYDRLHEVKAKLPALDHFVLVDGEQHPIGR